MDKLNETGILYLVATPIGNLADISSRAIETIRNSDIIAAEDTRHTGMLMKKLGLSVRMESYHEHNKTAKGSFLVDKIKKGLKVSLVSDAGMPCISDPGNDLVKLCVKENIAVVVIPGPCAAVSAISGCDFDTSRFVFEGFIPVKGTQRKIRIEEIEDEKRTVVIYEAPHRIQKTLKDLSDSGMGQRRVTLARELTKLYEEFIRSNVDSAIEYFSVKEPRGEFVIVIEGKNEFLKRVSTTDHEEADNNLDIEIEEFIFRQIKDGLSANDIAKMTAIKFSIQKKDAYRLVVSLKNKETFDK